MISPRRSERDVTQAFGPGGMLARSRDFEYRPQQQTMAAAVAKACQNRTHLLVEAGTGVGKSLAYLVPAVLHAQAENRKALVSTHTINLQEQLFYKDIPLVQKLLPQEFKAVLLKGRQNYLCPRRLDRAMTHGTELFANREQDELKRLWEWSQVTRDGTLSDLDPAPDPQVWLQVCSEAHVCTPRTCGLDNRCFYQNARKEAEMARVVVLNHSLFFNFLAGAEAVLEERGYLFHNDFIIFDEAHTLEGVAARHLGLEISHGSLRYLLHRLFHPRTQKGIVAALHSGEAMKLVLQAEEESDLFFDRLERSLRFPQRAKELRLREPGIAENTLDLPLTRLYRLLADEAREIDDEVFKAEVQEAARRVDGMRVSLAEFIDQSRTDHVYWIERHEKREARLTLTAAPIEVATQLRAAHLPAGKHGHHDQRDAGGRRRPALFRQPHRRGGRRHAAGRFALRLRAADEGLHPEEDAGTRREGALRGGAQPLDPPLRRADARQGVRPLHQLPDDAAAGRPARLVFPQREDRLPRAGRRDAAPPAAAKVQGRPRLGPLRHRLVLAGRRCAGRGAEQRHPHAPALCRAGPSADAGQVRAHRRSRAATRSASTRCPRRS